MRNALTIIILLCILASCSARRMMPDDGHNFQPRLTSCIDCHPRGKIYLYGVFRDVVRKGD